MLSAETVRSSADASPTVNVIPVAEDGVKLVIFPLLSTATISMLVKFMEYFPAGRSVGNGTSNSAIDEPLPFSKYPTSLFVII